MTSDSYANLSWLPRPPGDFSARCRTALETDDGLGRRLQGLAGYGLDENQLNRLAKIVDKARLDGRSLAPLTPFRLGIISNATSHFIVPALVATAARYGIALECIEADYGQEIQEALDPESLINKARLDAVLIAVDYRGLPLRPKPGDAAAAEETVQTVLQHLSTLRSGFRANSKAICIVQTLPRPVEVGFGSFDMVLPGTERSLIDAVNHGIAGSLANTEDVLFDVAGLAETVGLANWHDSTIWNIAKAPFSSTFLPLYADHLARLIGALRGKSRRCLILDLDNTLWGGVIGDDGLEGIVIGQGDPTGEAHLSLQRTALMLRDRGIVLAVSSKNTDEIARKPFQKHPEMLLRENHFAVFQANWNDKATNIKAIAEELSLGLDAMVFLDDNPVERDLVRSALPQVAVPELSNDPASFARTLLATGYFEAIAFSGEDLKRAEFYQDNARRIALQKQVGDVDAYLASLRMVMTIQPFDATGRARISQLINKSNQFNLTTRRYSESEVGECERDPDCLTMQIRLADSFGDNGIISIIICRRVDSDWIFDTWLMSCRVLGRKVENAVLAEILALARARGIRRLVGTYIPTERNKLVEEHYAKLGFSLVERRDDGTTVWELPVATAPVPAIPMEIRRIGYPESAASESLDSGAAAP